MAIEKIQKINSTTARQVTFPKSRRGLIKKAKKLSILFKYSSSSMKNIIRRRKQHSKSPSVLDQPSLDQQLENSRFAMLSKKLEERRLMLRRMRGEELEGLSLHELQRLKENLEAGLKRVREAKEKRAKEMDNLISKVMEISRAEKPTVVDTENSAYEDGESSDSLDPQDPDATSDTSLKLE